MALHQGDRRVIGDSFWLSPDGFTEPEEKNGQGGEEKEGNEHFHVVRSLAFARGRRQGKQYPDPYLGLASSGTCSG